MCMVDGDGAEFWTESEVTARKAHRCDECGRTVQPGERYWKAFGVQDGSSFRNTTCAHCHVGQRLLARECGGFLHEMVIDELRDHTEGLPWSGLAARLFIGMRRGWKRFSGAGLMPVPVLPARAA